MVRDLEDYAIVVQKGDNVAIARDPINPGTEIDYNGQRITVERRIETGHRFAITEIPKRGPVIQYGEPFGKTRIRRKAGSPVGIPEVSNRLSRRNLKIPRNHYVEPPEYFDDIKGFKGYKRVDGRVGTRNHFLIIPVSFCADQIAYDIEEHFSQKTIEGIDRVVALDRNSSGCGESKAGIEIAKRIYINYARHPNVGGVLFVENGCEKACFDEFRELYEQYKNQKPTGWLSLQKNNCNFRGTVKKGIEFVGRNLERVAEARRVEVKLSDLVFGVECGGSNTFSGLSGNLALGEVSDYIVRSRGIVIMSEAPEFCGAEHILARRGKNREIAKRVLGIVEWYKKLAKRNGATLEDNPSVGNKREGLINIAIKSLGAIRKGGATRIEEVIDYGQIVEVPGLNVMQGPGGDVESMVGLVASGATVIGFSTGCGTPTGNPIVPVIKVINTSRYEGADIFDYDTGPLVSREGKSIGLVREELLEKVVRVANGGRTRAEVHRCKDFMIWPGGSIST